MKVLVTGATGFIGNYVIEELLAKNIEVIATSTNIEKAESFAWYNKIIYKPFLFINSEMINAFDYFNKPTIVIHLAWQGLPNYKDDFHLLQNLPEHKFFLSNLICNGLQSLLVTGTCLEYGMKEGELCENNLCNPNISYAQAKHELHLFLHKISLEKSLRFHWVRLFYMYGKGQNPKSLMAQLEKAIENNESNFNMSGGEQMRDFLPVEVVAKNIVTIALQNKCIETINCCSGNPISIKAFVQEQLNIRKKSINLNLGFYPYQDYEPFNFWGSDKILKTIL